MLERICPTCDKHLLLDESFAGDFVICSQCRKLMLDPAFDGAAATATPEHAKKAKIGTPPSASDSSIQEGLPPPFLQEPRLRIDYDPPVRSRLDTIVTFTVLGIALCTIVGLAIPAVLKVREAAARTQSVNNLKQIGLSMQSFHDGNKRLPFNGIAAGKKVTPKGSETTYFGNATTDCASSGSWLFQILPYMDAMADHPFRLSGVKESDVVPPFWQNRGWQNFMCPGRGRPAFITDAGPWSDYHINILLNGTSTAVGFDVPDVKRTMLGITDGSSNTIFAGHGYMNRDAYSARTSQGNFSSVIWRGGTEGTGRALGVKIPAQLKAGNGPVTRLIRDSRSSDNGITNATSPQPWGGPFPQGALFVWCDGTVRMVPYSTTQSEGVTVFGSYLTPTNGEGAGGCQ